MKRGQQIIFIAIVIVCSLLLTSWIKKTPGKTYDEVQIGTQIWMDKNLDVVTFRNGDTIAQAKTMSEWGEANRKEQPAWCYYNNDSINNAIYGKLYNWSAVRDKRGLAPVGWHIPSAFEWRRLYEFLGGRHGEVARDLKSKSGWHGGRNGEDRFGFNAVPAGIRTFAMINPNDAFRWQTQMTAWWSCCKPKNWPEVECFTLRDKGKAMLAWESLEDGFSVRCIKD